MHCSSIYVGGPSSGSGSGTGGGSSSGGGTQPADTTPSGPLPTAPAGWARTVVLMERQTSVGQDLFIRGGLDHKSHTGEYTFKLDD